MSLPNLIGHDQSNRIMPAARRCIREMHAPQMWQQEANRNMENIGLRLMTNLYRHHQAAKRAEVQSYGFTYAETQLRTFLTPAIFHLADGLVLEESPARRRHVDRRKSTYSNFGRLDYWFQINKYSYILETKLAFLCRKRVRGEDIINLRQDFRNKQREAKTQLEAIHKESDYDLSANTIGIACTFCPIYSTIKSPQEGVKINKISKISDQVVYNIGKQLKGENISLALLFDFPSQMRCRIDYSSGRSECYSGMMLFVQYHRW